ncbi:MAG: hypothetical protein K0U36_06335 [Alphaproteobacteria bacterium]|nr:hypothetical protein [Alphaproteobacteria bacterium]
MAGGGSLSTSNYVVTSISGTWVFDDGSQSVAFDFGDHDHHVLDSNDGDQGDGTNSVDSESTAAFEQTATILYDLG